MLMRVWRWFLRELANITLIPALRVAFLRLSGIHIDEQAFVNMKVLYLDGYRGGQIHIGKRVAIAPHVSFITESNPNNSRLRLIPEFSQAGPIQVGDDAWIGAGAIILPGTRIGACAVIAAGAIITGDVPDYAIMAGVPARQIGDVRDREGADKLLNSKAQ